MKFLFGNRFILQTIPTTVSSKSGRTKSRQDLTDSWRTRQKSTNVDARPTIRIRRNSRFRRRTTSNSNRSSTTERQHCRWNLKGRRRRLWTPLTFDSRTSQVRRLTAAAIAPSRPSRLPSTLIPRPTAIPFNDKPEVAVHFPAKTCPSTTLRNGTLPRRENLSARPRRRRRTASARCTRSVRRIWVFVDRRVSLDLLHLETAVRVRRRRSWGTWTISGRPTRRLRLLLCSTAPPECSRRIGFLKSTTEFFKPSIESLFFKCNSSP